MSRRKLVLIVGLVLVVLAVAAGAIAAAKHGEEPLRGETRDRAVAAALAHTGGGTVTETEEGDDGAAYSVEIRLDDGREVEVDLDRSFEVIGQEADDDDGAGDDDGDRDD